MKLPQMCVVAFLAFTSLPQSADAGRLDEALALADLALNRVSSGQYQAGIDLLNQAEKKKRDALRSDHWNAAAHAHFKIGMPSAHYYARAHLWDFEIAEALTKGDSWFDRFMKGFAVVGQGALADTRARQRGDFGTRHTTQSYHRFKELGLKGPTGNTSWRKRVRSVMKNLKVLAKRTDSPIQVCGNERPFMPCSGLQTIITSFGVCPAVSVSVDVFLVPAACIADHWRGASIIHEGGLQAEDVSSIDSCYGPSGSACSRTDLIAYVVVDPIICVGTLDKGRFNQEEPTAARSVRSLVGYSRLMIAEMPEALSWIVPVAETCSVENSGSLTCPNATEAWGAVYGEIAGGQQHSGQWEFIGFYSQDDGFKALPSFGAGHRLAVAEGKHCEGD